MIHQRLARFIKEEVVGLIHDEGVRHELLGY
jgi:hypothetical protein